MQRISTQSAQSVLRLERTDWRYLLEVAPLAAALVAAIAVYLPSLNSAFFGDDYVYLVSVRKLSFWHYVRVSVVPGSNDPTFVFAHDYWRPLYFLSYQPLGRLFGDNVVPYHLVNLGVHLAGVVLVWMLARRLTGRWLAAGVAAAIFAVNPIDVAAVNWISSLNSAALPLGIGSWLCFVSAAETPAENVRRRWTRIAASVLLFAGAVGFRETAVVFLAAMAIWYVLVPARRRLIESRLMDWHIYPPLVPFVLLGLAYLLVRTRLFTIPASSPSLISTDPGFVLQQSIEYWKLALTPFGPAAHGWEAALQRAGVVVILLTVAAALATRRWLLLSLILGFLVSVIPYATSTFGVGGRYFYFPCSLFAMAAGAGAVELIDVVHRFILRRIAVAGAGGLLVFGLVGLGYAANARAHDWVRQNPDVNQAWLAQLQARYPVLPEGGTLYVENAPLVMQLFGGYVADYTVWYHYPQVAKVADIAPGDRLHLGPNDRVFVYRAENATNPIFGP